MKGMCIHRIIKGLCVFVFCFLHNAVSTFACFSCQRLLQRNFMLKPKSSMSVLVDLTNGDDTDNNAGLGEPSLNSSSRKRKAVDVIDLTAEEGKVIPSSFVFAASEKRLKYEKKTNSPLSSSKRDEEGSPSSSVVNLIAEVSSQDKEMYVKSMTDLVFVHTVT
jgi:hypothetical protein